MVIWGRMRVLECGKGDHAKIGGGVFGAFEMRRRTEFLREVSNVGIRLDTVEFESGKCLKLGTETDVVLRRACLDLLGHLAWAWLGFFDESKIEKVSFDSNF